MSVSEIIELRQADRDNQTVEVDGAWTNSINDPVSIYEGDTVAVRNVFLDTQASNEQGVHIANDLELTLQTGYYYQNIREDFQDATTLATGYYTAPGPFIDAKTYILMQGATSAAGNYYLGDIIINSEDFSNPTQAWKPTVQDLGNQGAWPTFFWQCGLYYREAGSTVTKTATLNISDNGARTWFSVDPIFSSFKAGYQVANNPVTESFAFDVTAKFTVDYNDGTGPVEFTGLAIIPGTLKAIQVGKGLGADSVQMWPIKTPGSATYDAINWKFSSTGKQFQGLIKLDSTSTAFPAAAGDKFQPLVRSTQFTLPAGDYTPQELTQRINRVIQGNNTTDLANPVLSSNFLIKYNSVDFPRCVWVADDRSNAFILDTGSPTDPSLNGGMLIGATQMVLDYDTDKQVYYWAYYHSPAYGLASTTNYEEVVGFIQSKNVPSLKVGGADQPLAFSRNSGVYFTGLHDVDKVTGSSIGFWDKLLGFQTNESAPDAIVPYMNTFEGFTIGAFAPSTFEFPAAPLTPGQYTTTGYIGLDDLAERSASSDYWHMPPITSATPFVAGSNGVTLEVRASSIPSKTNDIGYYLIDIASQFGAPTYVGGDGYRSRNIRAIVSRYYAQASYTAGSPEDAIVYTHSGPPIALNSFGVRILGPDKEVAPNIGSDSTIMLEVVRAPPKQQDEATQA